MLKKCYVCFFSIVILLCSIPAFASEGENWKALYTAKMEEICDDYKNGTKYVGDYNPLEIWGEASIYFSLQDINFDGIPELYHGLCSMFELEPSIETGTEEIYYIKDGKVVQGEIKDGSSFCLIPMYAGEKANPGDVTASRWQYAMRDKKTGEVCFITNDSYSGFIESPSITYSKLIFDSTTGILRSEVLLYKEMESYTKPVYLQGYDYVGADCYTSLSRDGWGIIDWKPAYIAPSVVVNDRKLEFDVQPQIVNDRTLVPFRAICKALGAEVFWDDVTSTVTVIKNNVTIKMTIGSDLFMINDKTEKLDSPAIIIGSRTLVPVRVVAETFGCSVNWDNTTRTVVINGEM